jgi:hypothetical protein
MNLLLCSLLLGAAAQAAEIPGWLLRGSNPRAFEIAVDRETLHSGSASGTIRCAADDCEPFGTILQAIRADEYRGKRVRLTAWVKALRAAKPRLWMRVDGAASEMLAFDNMETRAKSGTFGWTRQEIVLDVASPAALVYFGVILGGGGQVWIDDIVLEVVPRKTKSTNQLREPTPPKGDPIKVAQTYQKASAVIVNGDFEQPAQDSRSPAGR